MASVRKRDPKDPKSPWVCEYTNPSTGKRIRITPETGLKKDAEAARRKVEAEIERGEHVTRSESLTVNALLQEFLKHSADRILDGSIGKGHYVELEANFRVSISPHIGNVLVTKLRSSDVEDLYRKLVRECGLAPSTAKRRIIQLRSVEKFAYRRGYVKKTPVEDALEVIRGGAPAKIRIFTAEEVRRLIDETKRKRRHATLRSSRMLECVVNLAAFCGLRFGEITGLSRSSLDLVGRTLMIRQSSSKHDGIKTPKTKAGIRDVPIPPHIAILLRRWLDDYYLENDGELLFVTKKLRPLLTTCFHQAMWHPLLASAGLGEGESYHFHALRHFAASWWISNGLDLPTVAALLGHSKVDMTLSVYAHSIVGKTHRHAFMDQMAGGLLDMPRTLTVEAVAPGNALDATRMRH